MLMRLVVMWLLLLPTYVWAVEHCSIIPNTVKPSDGFESVATITQYQANNQYDLFVSKANESVVIWSTYDQDVALFDSEFKEGESYQLRYVFVPENKNGNTIQGTMSYSRRLVGSATWNNIAQVEMSFHNGANTTLEIRTNGSGLGLMSCSDEVLNTSSFEVCDYFPEPAQSWGENSGAFFGSSQNDLEPTPYHLGGWTKSYTDQYESTMIFGDQYGGDGKQQILSIPFDRLTASRANVSYQASGNDAAGTVNISYYDASTLYLDSRTESGYDDYNYYNSCNGRECRIATGGQPVPPKIPTPEPVTPTFTSTKNLIIEPGNYDSECPTDGSSPYCKSTIDGNVRTIEITSDINNLQINGPSGNSKVILKFIPNNSDSEYGRKIKEFNVTTGNVDVTFDEDGTYTFDIFHLSVNTSSLSIDAKTLIKVKTLFQLSNSVPLTQATLPEHFVIYGPEAIIDFSGENKLFYGMFLAKNIQFNNTITFYGSVTTNNLILPNDNTIIGSGACIDPQPPTESYTIDVIPDYQFSLMCQTPEIRIEVKNEEGTEIATGYDGNVKVSVEPAAGLTLNQPTTGSLVSEGIYKPDAGVVVIPVESSSLNEYTVSATLSTDSTQTDQGVISFVPFSFDVDEQYVIANKPKNVTVKALACDTEEKGKVVAVNYEGTPDVQSELEAPAGGIGALSFAPVFTTENEGTIDTSLMFTESGKLKVTLTDDRFNCTGYEGCPIGEDGEANGVLQGSFYVSSRPWTFAICDSNGSAMGGNITDAASQKFIAAGEEFSLYVKPLKWVTGDTDPLAGDENINVSTYCDQPITQNFALSDTATAATIILDSVLAQPTPERGGVLGTLSGVTSLTNVDSSGSGSDIYYNFANLSWSEVGVLTIQADTQSNYLGMNVNMGYRNIGRFYPDHFTLEGSNLWDYSPSHNGFAYMNQPIKMNYTVKAKNRQDGDTENYGLFDASLLAAFNLEAKEKTTVSGSDVFGASLVDRVHLGSDTPVSWNKASYSFSSDDFIFLKKVEESAPYTSTTDGPFDDTNAVFGLSVDPSHSTYQNKDEVNFDKDFLATTESFVFPANNGLDDIAVSFVNQPDFRYGRMVLGNVSGPIGGPISVPLRTEYWSGSSFVTNTDDSGSKFKANIYYVMSNHADSGAKLTSTNSANEQSVSAGKSSVLKASQDTPQRETVRLFLRQGNDSDGIGNNATPVEDDELNATNEGWKNAQDMGQPWLQFNWRSKGDEDPSTLVNFGAYRGNDRVIYRGEPNLTVN